MRKLIRKICGVFLSLAMVFTLVACAPQDISKKNIELKDQAGRTVTLEKQAEKIVSCYYISTYACLSLGLGDSIVGLEKKAEKRPIYKMAQPSLLELPQVGTLKQLNIEAVASLEPDLVILPLKLKDNIKALEDLGLTVMVVNPETHDQLVEMIDLIGQATGTSAQSDKLTQYYEDQLAKLGQFTTNTKQTVYMGSNSSYLETAPSDMYQSQLIETAGGENAAKSLKGNYWTQVSYESLLAMNPDMIVIPVGASYSVEDIYKDQRLQTLNAVQNKAIYQMPQGIEEWDSPIPSGILGTMWLASLIHEEYSFDNFVKDAKSFYKTFYGFDIDTTLITK